MIKAQFSQQAVPFASTPVLSNDQTNRLVINTLGIDSHDVVLDVACGPGLITCAIAEVAKCVTGVDITPAMIQQARQKKQNRPNMEWVIGDVEPLPFNDAQFSVVVTRYSFHHFLDPISVLGEMVRVCEPGGTIGVVDMFTSSEAQAQGLNRMEQLRDPSHTRALPREELTAMFHAIGLRNLKTEFYKVDVDLEDQLSRSFPNPGDADRIRQIFRHDLATGQLGLETAQIAGRIRYAYPIMILVGHKA